MAVTRAMSITYGAQAIPGAVAGARLELHGPHKITQTDTGGEVTFQFTVNALGSAAVLAAACEALEVTFRTRRLALLVELDDAEALKLDDADNSGFDVTPEIRKLGETSPQWDSNTSRLYEVTIRGGTPSLGTDSRQEFSHTVTLGPSVRGTLEVRGVYTAVEGGADAEANFLALIDARVATIVTALTGVWETISETRTPDDTDTTVAFTRTLREILSNQASGLLNAPAIVDPNLLVTRGKRSPEGGLIAVGVEQAVGQGVASGAPDPLLTITAEYSSAVDKTVTTDLLDVFESIVRPVIFEQMELVAGGGVAIISVEPRLDFYNNTIGVSVVGETKARSNVLDREVETVDEVDFGKIIRDVWPDEVPKDEEKISPAPTQGYVYQTRRIITRTITTLTTTLAGAAGGQEIRNQRTVAQAGTGQPATRELGGATFKSVLMFRTVRSKRSTRGIREFGNTFAVLEREFVEVFRVLAVITSSGEGASAAQTSEVGGDAGSGGSAGR